MSFERELCFGRVAVSPDAPPVFLPDIDVYFKGDVSVALGLLDRLKAAGCRVVKGALIHDLEVCFDGPVEASWFKPGEGVVRERYRDVMRRHLLPLADARTIYRRAAELGMEPVLTVYDEAGLDFALAEGVAALKVASSNITHAPLIRRIAAGGKPVILDTGRSTQEEIARAVGWIREAGAREFVIEHSPAPPPAPLSEHHLRMMPALGAAFGCPFGLSDHHAGTEMMLAAVALGACVIEKGVCADDAQGDIDLAHAARIGEVAAIVRQIENAWGALGSTARSLPAGSPRPVDRMGLVASRAVAAGEVLSRANLRFAFALPQEAVGTEYWDAVAGRRAARAIAANQPIGWEDVDAPRPR